MKKKVSELFKFNMNEEKAPVGIGMQKMTRTSAEKERYSGGKNQSTISLTMTKMIDEIILGNLRYGSVHGKTLCEYQTEYNSVESHDIVYFDRYKRTPEDNLLLTGGMVMPDGIIEEYDRLKTSYQTLKESISLKEMADKNEYDNRVKIYKSAKDNQKLIASSGCKGSVACSFLEKAKKEALNLNDMVEENKSWKAKSLAVLEQDKLNFANIANAITVLGYDRKEVQRLNEVIEQNKDAYTNYQQLANYDKQIVEINRRLEKEMVKQCSVETDLKETGENIKKLLSLLSQKETLKEQFDAIKKYIDLERGIDGNKKIMVIKKETMTEKTDKLAKLDQQIKNISETEAKLIARIDAFTEKRSINEIEQELKALKIAIKDLYFLDAKLNVRRDELASKQDQVKNMQDTIQSFSKKLTHLNLLKEACSFTGIPHLIISEEILIIENKANAILSQMSKGKLSLSFVTEKLTKNGGGKEIPILDVYINEQGTGTLSYMSRSGGERVKVSLASALALAELKATKTGIQLGFLFIDEPPFLDQSGMESYCDALEDIHRRYAGMKVIAITHDPSMQSRFPQVIEIVKTDEGSHIIK